MMNEAILRELETRYAVDVAAEHGISEGELANLRLARDALMLDVPDIKRFIADLEALGHVKCITRNRSTISVQEGVYGNQHLHGYGKIDVSAEAGLVLNPRKLDLRIFFRHWNHVYYIDRIRGDERQPSFQIFDRSGQAIHKVFMTADSDESRWSALLEKYRAAEQTPAAYEAGACRRDPVPLPVRELNRTIDADWRAMHEVHDFYLLMRKHRLSRQALFRCVDSDLAQQVDNTALAELLSVTQAQHEELTIFVANRGCVQIYTGLPDKVFSDRGWLNLFSSGNKIHLWEADIDECWVVRKPGEHGYVTSLEVFSGDGEQIIQIYGQRNEGQEERASWRAIAGGLHRPAAADASRHP